MSIPWKQKIIKDIGLSSTLGTQSATAKRSVHFCKKNLKQNNLSWLLIFGRTQRGKTKKKTGIDGNVGGKKNIEIGGRDTKTKIIILRFRNHKIWSQKFQVFWPFARVPWRVPRYVREVPGLDPGTSLVYPRSSSAGCRERAFPYITWGWSLM